MSASASKKRRKELELQGLSAKDIAVKEEKEQRSKLLRNGLIVALVVAVCVAAVFAVISLVNRPSYDTKAAAATVGDEKITVPMYDYFYNLTASNFYSSYSFLFEAGKPLSEQSSFLSEGTMEDYLKDTTNSTLQEIFNVYAKAKADEYKLSDEDKASMETALENLENEASSYGFPNLDKYLRARFGEGCDEDSYKEYMKVFLTYSGFATKLQEDFAPTAEELDEAYNKDTSAYDLVRFTYKGVAAESTPVEQEAPADDSDDQDSTDPTAAPETTEAPQTTETVYTDEAKAAAKEEAEHYLTEMPEDATTVTYNKSSASSLNEEIAEWLFEEGRQEGDVKVFAKNEDESYFYAVRFEARDTNDYYPINATIISITKDAEDAEVKEGEQTAEEKYEALKNAVKDGMTDEEFNTAVTALGYSGDTSAYTRTYSIEQIRDFLFDESRKAGDVTTVETDTIYYVVRYASVAEDTYRDTMVKNTLWSEFYKAIATANTIEVDEEMLKNAYTDLTFNASSSSEDEASVG